MTRIPNLGLLALLVIVIACVLAPTASASFTCTGGRATCVITLTATAADPSRSGSTAFRSTFPGGLAIETCTDFTISSDVRDPARTGASNITFTGANVTFTGCSLNLDANCTVTITPPSGDSRWTITISASPRGTTSYSTGFSIGAFTSSFRTCRDAGNNGTIDISGQNLGTTCARYTAGATPGDGRPGILTLTSCRVAITSTVRNIAGGTETVSVSYHATVDGTIGPASPTISNDP